MDRYDVAVIGGGMVGAALALALSQTRQRVLLIEGTAPDSHTHASFDERTTALGNASRRIFEALGVWSALAPAAAAIRTIHVSDAGRFGVARLQASEQGIEAFGYVIANRVLGAALWQALGSAKGVTLQVPATPRTIEIGAEGVRIALAGADGEERIETRLAIGADGAASVVRQAAGIEARVEDYAQVALVSNVAADRPHQGTAYERFTPAGPLAVLPLHDGSYTSVWTRSPAEAARALELDATSYLRELQAHFGWRAGRLVRAGTRAAYPLKLTRALASTGPRTALVGNAAQALHPVAGQGFNLGLRDAAMLAEVLAQASADPGAPAVLAEYAAARSADRRGMIAFTDSLVRLFASPLPGMALARNLGLLLFDLTPPAKSALARVSTGFGGKTPRLARGLALR